MDHNKEQAWHRVLATHEEAQELALGPWLGDDFLGVALPDRNALQKQVEVRFEGNSILATVADVGPWCVDDSEYVFGNEMPRAQKLLGLFCTARKGTTICPTVPDGQGGMRAAMKSNGAGIDLFPEVARRLGIGLGRNVWVDWRFFEI
jgi:hypothetical protein